ncbi:MAG: hypothetical protein NVS4B6_28230 [Mycobacterium sp.]
MLADFEPYPSAKWFSYSGDALDGLVYAFDAAVEGGAGARVFQIRGGALHQTFMDLPAVCKPAEVRNDGSHLLLLAYTTFIDQVDCEAECTVLLREDVGVEPAWLDVLEWRGTAWRPASRRLPTLYKTLAEGYRKAVLFTVSAKGDRCSSGGDSRTKQLEAWALRAERLAQ